MPTRWERRDFRVGVNVCLKLQLLGRDNTNGDGVSGAMLYSSEPFLDEDLILSDLIFKGLKTLPACTKQLDLLQMG